MAKTKEEKKKKKSYGKVIGFCVVVAIIASLFGWGFGGGGGWPWARGNNGRGDGRYETSGNYDNGDGYQTDNGYVGDGADNGNADDYYTQPDENGLTDAPEPPPELVIRVSEGLIFHGDSEDDITLARLEELLLELNQPGDIWELRDEQSVVEVFANVRALLAELGIDYLIR